MVMNDVITFRKLQFTLDIRIHHHMCLKWQPVSVSHFPASFAKKIKCVPLLSAETKAMQFSILVCQKLMLEEEITTILDSAYSLIHSWQTRSPKVFNTLINCLYHLQTLKGTVYLIWEPMSALLCLHRGHQWAGQSFIMRPQAQLHAHLKNKVTLCGWDQLKIWFRLSDDPLKCLERTQIYTWSEHLFWC